MTGARMLPAHRLRGQSRSVPLHLECLRPERHVDEPPHVRRPAPVGSQRCGDLAADGAQDRGTGALATAPLRPIHAGTASQARSGTANPPSRAAGWAAGTRSATAARNTLFGVTVVGDQVVVGQRQRELARGRESERDAALDREGHRVAILVAQQRGQRRCSTARLSSCRSASGPLRGSRGVAAHAVPGTSRCQPRWKPRLAEPLATAPSTEPPAAGGSRGGSMRAAPHPARSGGGCITSPRPRVRSPASTPVLLARLRGVAGKGLVGP